MKMQRGADNRSDPQLLIATLFIMLPSSIREIKKAIKEMKHGKGPGAVDICAKLLKVKESVTPTILLKIFYKIGISDFCDFVIFFS